MLLLTLELGTWRGVPRFSPIFRLICEEYERLFEMKSVKLFALLSILTLSAISFGCAKPASESSAPAAPAAEAGSAMGGGAEAPMTDS